MEWYDHQALEDETKSSRSRVLTTTTGNVQTFSLGSKHHFEENGSPSLEHVRTLREPSRQHYPTPQATLRSNDRRVILRQKLNARRLKKRLRYAQAYLHHPKFIAFKARPRKGVKDTGEAIWDEETEAAFQNAVINIPAMGRRKKSQHGKTFGRNELIAEWIKQETGRERTRKQVSSHMQTLDNLFKSKPDEEFSGIPEWAMINKGADDPITEADGPEFYDNSIADMVRNWRMLQVDLSQIDGNMESTLRMPVPGRGSDISQLSPLSKLELEMWVSVPDKMEEPLHKYTRMQSSLTTSAPEPLDDVGDWRSVWPDFESLLERTSENKNVEVVLVEAGFELMLDFPPPRSKLGISLELDFTSCVYDRSHADGPTNWTCQTDIYQRGKLEWQAEHSHCHCPGPGRVKPPFESKWWAEQFTRLTERRRHALDSGNDAAVAVADQSAHDYLNNLGIMQQIFVSSEDLSQTNDIVSNATTGDVLVAILLWSFSQTPPGSPGITFWRKIILPSHHGHHLNHFLHPPETDLPPQPPEHNVESSFRHDLDPDIDTTSHSLQNGYTHTDDPDEELCQDGFVMIGHHNDSATMSVPYNGQATFDNFDARYHNQQAFQGNNQYMPQYHMQYTEHSSLDVPSHNYEPQDPLRSGHIYRQEFGSQHFVRPIGYPEESDWSRRRQALINFDLNTHKLLQTQLQTTATQFDPRQTHSAPPIEPPQAPSQGLASSATDTDNPLIPLTKDHTASIQDTTHLINQPANDYTSPHLIAPRAIRPSLQHHHSFAGVLTHPPVDLDDTTRHDFSLLLDSLDGSFDHIVFPPERSLVLPSQSDVLDLGDRVGLGLGLEFGFGSAVMRPYSQPVACGAVVEGQDGLGVVVSETVEGAEDAEWLDVKIEGNNGEE